MFRRALTKVSLLCVIIFAFAAISRADSKSARGNDLLAGTNLAVTIDDIPENYELPPGVTRADIANAMINALKENHVDNAFGFTNGDFMSNNPQEFSIFKKWLKAGYPLGNHTYDHPDLNQVGAEAFIESIAKQDQLLAKLANYSPLIQQRFMFRYPFLDEGATLQRRDGVRDYLASHHYQIAEVTVDFHDWAWNAAYFRCIQAKNQPSIEWLKTHFVEGADQYLEASNSMSEQLFGRRIPQILLIHDGAFQVLMFDAILKHWRASGVQFISLKQALADPAYKINPNDAYTGGHTFLGQVAEARGIGIGALEPQKYSIERLNAVCAAPPSPTH